MPRKFACLLRPACFAALMMGPLVPGAPAAEILYNVTNLGIREPIALNDAGQVALNQWNQGRVGDFVDQNHPSWGHFATPYPVSHAVLYDSYGANAGGMTYVGQGITTTEGDVASSLNAAGQIEVHSASGAYLTDGKSYKTASAHSTLVGTLPNGSPVYAAENQTLPDYSYNTYRLLADSSHATNARGQVAGNTWLSNGLGQAVIIDSGKATPLGGLGGFGSNATALSATGQVVGDSYIGLGQHAFLYKNGQMHDLGTLGGISSTALSINAQGQIVGNSDVPGSRLAAWEARLDHISNYYDQHAFVSDGMKMVDLNSLISEHLGITLHRAIAINAAGQILAEGQAGSNYYENAYLLTPVDQPVPGTPTTAPEPSTLAILGLAAGAAWLRRRRARRAIGPGEPG